MSEPKLDIQRLARALHSVYEAEDVSGTCWHDRDAERVAREYDRIDPGAPSGDRTGYIWDCPNCGERITSFTLPPGLPAESGEAEALRLLRAVVTAFGEHHTSSVFGDGSYDRLAAAANQAASFLQAASTSSAARHQSDSERADSG